MNWLLDAAADDAEFNTVVAATVEARRKFPWIATYRATLANWVQARLANKDLAKRAQAAQAALAASDKEPVNAEWIAFDAANAANVWSPQAAAARAKLIAPARLATYPDELANDLLYQQQYFTRHYSPTPAQSIDVAKAWVARMPKSYDAAVAYLTYATDFAKPEAFRDAAPTLIKLEPTAANTDVARRLLTVAAHFKDNAVAAQAWAWTKKMFDKFGYDNASASTMGDTLAALGMKAEAKECWEKALTGSPDTQDYLQCAQRLVALLPDAQKPAFIDTLVAKDSGWHFSFAVMRADFLIKANDIDGAARLLLPAADKIRDRAFGAAAGAGLERPLQLGERVPRMGAPRRRSEGRPGGPEAGGHHGRGQAEAVHPRPRPERQPQRDDRPGGAPGAGRPGRPIADEAADLPRGRFDQQLRRRDRLRPHHPLRPGRDGPQGLHRRGDGDERDARPLPRPGRGPAEGRAATC